MDIAIVGTGYVGLVAATCFADAGHSLVCVDTNPEKLRSLKGGKAPFFEPELDALLSKNLSRMTFIDEVRQAVEKCPVIFVAVGTPELPDGSADLSTTVQVIEEVCAAATGPRLLVMKSTVPIGYNDKVKKLCRELSKHPIEVVSNPEFLRQGCAVKDFLYPDRVVIGCESETARQMMTEIYQSFVKSREQIFFMDNTSAEMVKYAANSFLALKISFINEIALLATKFGADIDRVRAGFTSDHRINPAFFNPGIGFGGSCFPKDVHALMHTAKQAGIDMKTLRATDEVNERQKSLFSDLLVKRFGSLKDRTIAMWGLAFKPQTDDVRRAPSLRIIEELHRLGARVVAYDPVATNNARAACQVQFATATSPLEAVQGADALLVVTEWSQFRDVDFQAVRTALKSPVVLDGRNILSPTMMGELGFEYYGVGRPSTLVQLDT